MKRRKVDLGDVLRSALERQDGVPVPTVDMWRLAMEPSDVQKHPERSATPPGEVVVILGISGQVTSR